MLSTERRRQNKVDAERAGAEVMKGGAWKMPNGDVLIPKDFMPNYRVFVESD
jgi:hypothetical protein